MLQERPEPFNPSNHNIVDWVELFQLYVELHDIGAAKTKNLLLTHVQHEVFATLKNLVAPAKITEAAITTAKLTQLLEKHYRVVTNKHVARQAFARLVQGPAESVTQFSLRLRKGALECDFGAQFDERLRDQILIGIADVQFKEKIYTDATLDTFDKVVQAAVDKEHIHAQMKRLTIQSSNQEVNAIQSSYSSQQRGNTSNFSSRSATRPAQTTAPRGGRGGCRRCGRDHQGQACRFLNAKCFHCGITGHIAAVCQKKAQGKPPSQNVHFLEPQTGQSWETENEKEEESETHNSQTQRGEAQLYQIRLVTPLGKPRSSIRLQVTMDGKPCKLDLDTGATETVIPWHLF